MSSQNNKRKLRTQSILRSDKPGVSFSIKTCRDYGLEWKDCLSELLSIGVKRFRLMSYWDLHEPINHQLDFSLLDAQIEMIRQAGATVTLCIGIRQPRWPESHIPKWALELDEDTRTTAYISYHMQVINRYKNMPHIESWQLENEFWNRSFGLNNTFSRGRLVKEFSLLRDADPDRPIIMSLGNTVGLPLFAPKPDIFGTTMYLIQYEKGKYSHTSLKPWYFALRSKLVRLLGRKDLLIHELQAEPWGPKANWEMSDEEQAKSMNPEQLAQCVKFARASGIVYMDLWGSEWWFWRKTTKNDIALWESVKNIFS